MKQEDEKLRIKLISFNSKEQNEQILFLVIQEKNFAKLCKLIKLGYPITPFVLNCINDFWGASKIVDILKDAIVIDENCYDWLVLAWGDSQTKDFLVQNDMNDLIEAKFSDDDMLNYGLKKLLNERYDKKIGLKRD